MRFRTNFFLLILLLIFAQILVAEEESEEETYETSEYSSLLFYELFPLDARYASKKDWQNFYFLDDEQIGKLSAVKIEDKADLKKAGLAPNVVAELLPYLSFNSGSIYFLARLIDQQKYHDIPNHLHHSEKIFGSYKNSRFGFLLQKDAGETSHLDYRNWFFQQKNLPYISNIVLGSYKIRLGQGVVFGERFATTISALSTKSPIVSASKISPYTSFSEQWYMHGASVTAGVKSLHLTPYYSKTDLDVNLQNDSISSFDESGLHLHPSPTASLKTVGLYTQWISDAFDLGYNRAEVKFGKPFLDRQKSQSYQINSVDFRFRLENTDYFGEIAEADEKLGKVLGVRTIYENLHQTLIYREFEKNLPTYMGKPITQSNSYDNQKGLYYGALWKPLPRLKFNFYLDVWKTPETSAQAQMPLSGQELLVRGHYSAPRQLVSLQYKNQKKEQLFSDDEIGDQKICDYKADYHLMLGRFFKIKTRYNYRTCQEIQHKFGYLTYSELGFRQSVFALIARAVYYNAGTPVYMYQQGVDGTMLTSAFTGEDLFYYFLTNCKLHKCVNLQLKYSNYYKKTDAQEVVAQLLVNRTF